MDPITIAAVDALLVLRGRLVAQAAGARIAETAVQLVRARLPTEDPPSWRGDSARAEAVRVRQLAAELDAVAVGLADVAGALIRDVGVVDLHVG